MPPEAIVEREATIYEEGKHNTLREAKQIQKEKAWDLGSILFPLSFYVKENKKGSFWGELFDKVYSSDKREGELKIKNTEGKVIFSCPISAKNPIVFNDVFYDVIIPKIVECQAQITNEIVEKKKLCRPASVCFVENTE
jgi:hypothetical protein